MSRPTEFNWCFGHQNHLAFPNGGAPQLMPASQIETDEGCASISDSNGNLLFYTDGIKLWGKDHVQKANNLGGHKSACHSAIIVPPAGGGTKYHVFTCSFYNSATPAKHLSVETPDGVVFTLSPLVNATAFNNSERLAATSHTDCNKYWVMTQSEDGTELRAKLVKNDSPPDVADDVVYSDAKTLDSRGHMKFSPDGSILAFADPKANSQGEIRIFNFDRSTGILTPKLKITEGNFWALEFSSNSKALYFTHTDSRRNGQIFQYVIPGGISLPDVPLPGTNHIFSYPDTGNPSSNVNVLALQLGPDNKIYGVHLWGKDPSTNPLKTMCVINNPDNVTAPDFNDYLLDGQGNKFELHGPGNASLPTQTRIADDCVGGRCETIANEVNEALWEWTADHENALPHCGESDGIRPGVDQCLPLDLPEITPTYHVTWGASACDGMESDDVEVMTLSVCNPHSNVSLSNFVIHKLSVKMADGSDVALLPDGTDAVSLVSPGPHCFGELEPCSCVSRAFTVRTRGAAPGDYEIKVDGICFDVCTHHDSSTCFRLHVCEDQ